MATQKNGEKYILKIVYTLQWVVNLIMIYDKAWITDFCILLVSLCLFTQIFLLLIKGDTS